MLKVRMLSPSFTKK